MFGPMGPWLRRGFSGISPSGSVFFFAGRPDRLWADRRWGHLDDDVGGNLAIGSCRGFCSVPGPLQTVQRAEFWQVLLALQAADGIHLGVDNLGVVRHVGRLLDGSVGSRPPELVKDGDLILLIGRMLWLGVWTLIGLPRTRVMLMRLWLGMVGFVILMVGNNAADAADFGRRGFLLLLLMLAAILLGLWQVVSRSSDST